MNNRLRTLMGLALAFLLTFNGGAAFAQGSSDVARQIEQQYGVVGRDTEEGRRLNEQLQRVVERIVLGVNAERENREFNVRGARILGGRSEKNDQVINAFALPDGRIYVTLGLLRALENSPRMEDELAFVVGHEITHVVERHSAGQQKRALPAQVLAAILGAATKNRTLGSAAQVGAAAYAAKFSRQDEYRADRGGLLAMYHARYELQAATTMLRRLQSAGEERNRVVNGWFGSHPLTGNRVERVKELIEQIEAGRSPSPRGN